MIQDGLMAFIYFLFGLIIGSFLNVIIHRMPRGESVVLPPSHCPGCLHQLGFLDLIPILSFLLLGGRCRYCQAKISWRYPVVELLAGVISVLAWYKYGLSSNGLAVLIFSYILIAIALIDLEHQIIPNRLTIPAIIAGLVFRLWQGELLPALIGGLVGGGILFCIAYFYPDGMGMGDVKFLAMTGVFLGWSKALLVLFLGSFLGVLLIFPLIVLKKFDRKTPFPFGPFLVAGTLLIIYAEGLLGFIIRYLYS